MPSSKQSYYIKVSGYLVLGGKQFDISKVDLEFSLGDVGRAEVYVPVGRVCRSSSNMGVESSSAGMFDLVSPMTEATVYLKFEPKGAAAPKGRKIGFPPNQYFEAFIGYVQSPAQTRIYGGTANMVIKLFGKLGGLAGASSYVREFNLTPSANAAVPLLIGYEGQVAANIMDSYSLFYENITGDLWEGALKPILLQASNAKNTVTGNRTYGTETIKAAIARINTGQLAGKLAIRILKDEVRSLINKQLMKFLATAIHVLWKYDKGLSGGNLFSVIKQLESSFLYTLVPAIDHDGLLPLTQMLSYSYGDTIKPDEYFGESVVFEFGEEDYGYLTQVGVLPGTSNTTPWQESPTKAKFVGFALLSDLHSREQGRSPINELDAKWPSRVAMIRAQPWMLPPTPDAKQGNNAGGAVADQYETKGDPKTGEQWSNLELAYTEAGLGRNYALAYLANEIFYNRKMRFMGRARFDICPGSTIGIEVVEDPFSGVSPQVLYGFVEYVKINVGIGDGNPNASTAFGLSSVRTSKEHGAYTVDSHPMYDPGAKGAFRGAPLTEKANQ